MPTLNTYDVGKLVRCTAVFTNSAGEEIDPDAVYFEFRNPAGTVIAYQYGVGSEVVKTATGNYYVDVNTTTYGHGNYYYRFDSTGTGQTAGEHRFIVRASRVNVT